MKLINSTFDSRVLNDRIYGKFDRVYETHNGHYWDFDTDRELERAVGAAYLNECMYQPRKQNMRVRWRRKKKAFVENWDERPGGAGRDNWRIIDARLHGLARKFIGRRFDDCFSELRRRFFENKDWRVQACDFGTANHKSTRVLWAAMQDRFLSMFEQSRRGSSFGVDEDGLIYDVSEPHELMSNTPDEIRYKEFISAPETISDNPGYYAEARGVSKQELKEAVTEIINIIKNK